MADSRRFGLTREFNIEHLVLEAQQRWLRPTEICEILRNHDKFRIAPEPPNKPQSGSLFLFDRKVLRYFRKDGHKWRKKKDGKTVREAHERLKAESIDVLHCYYAHGEETENFQRRTYWMLEEAFMHIVLVHYLEVKGNKASFGRPRDEGVQHVTYMDSPSCSNSFANDNPVPSQNTDTESLNSAHMSEYGDAESDNNQARSRYHPFFELQQYGDGPVKNVHPAGPDVTVSSLIDHCDQQGLQAATPESDFYSISQEDKTVVFDDTSLGLAFSGSRTQFDLSSWDEVVAQSTSGFQIDFHPSLETEAAREFFTDDLGPRLTYFTTGQYKDESQLFNTEIGSLATSNTNLNSDYPVEGKVNSLPFTKQPSLDFSKIEGEGLKKHDSFSRWMSKELGEVEDSGTKYGFEAYWDNVENGSIVEDSSMSNPENLEAFLLCPSVSQDQLFSIIDFSPNWAYTDLTTKLIVTGNFLKNKQDVVNCKWSCMFGEVEVPAEVVADGTLRCHVPPHKAGRIPFYITCSNRLACSEVREFEYRDNDVQNVETLNASASNFYNMHLQTRLGKLLSLASVGQRPESNISNEKLHLSHKISSLLSEDDDQWFSMLNLANDKGVSPESIQDQLLQKLLKESLCDWLLQKVAEDGKGPNVLDEEGQGVLHLAAALGYDWAIKPTITAGVNINFRDARGWTALHWAATSGREHTVVSLISLGADSRALTDPTPEFSAGRTPADLASGSGHKGIGAFLAESSLNSQLSDLTLRDPGGFDIIEASNENCIEDIEKESSIRLADGDTQTSLKDSLSAVRNASLAAARIHQVFRVHSFQRKKLIEYGDDKCGISDECALSLLAVKPSKPGPNMPVHAAAIRIQNKFRGWKGRKEFLVIRQRIVKIQAHVRGHQVRKHYRKIVWTVGILEKVILRWRRKGSGLRGFRSEGLLEAPAMQTESSKKDDYDFLQEGRKQTEVRLEKALARVKSMVQYPEARDQYSRLMTAMQDKTLNDAEAADDGAMMELEDLWEDEQPMPTG